MMSPRVYDALRKEMKPLGAKLEAGVVTAVGTGVVTVSIGGTTVPDIPVVGGTTPSVSDNVFLLRQGTTVICFGNAT